MEQGYRFVSISFDKHLVRGSSFVRWGSVNPAAGAIKLIPVHQANGTNRSRQSGSGKPADEFSSQKTNAFFHSRSRGMLLTLE